MMPHVLAAMNAAIARPLGEQPRPAVAVEYRSTDTHLGGIASAASEPALLDWTAAWAMRWASHGGYCTAPARGADGRWYCRFRRPWRRQRGA